MIITEEIINKIDKLINRKMKRGFLAGLFAFLLAKVTHILVTFAFGLWLFSFFGLNETTIGIARIVDSPLFGIVYLVFATRLIYLNIIKRDTNYEKK